MKRSLLLLGFIACFSASAFADEIPGDIVDQQDFDPNVPYYQKLVPSWAAGIRIALPAIPIKAAIGSSDEFYLEKLLHFQKVGILSVGIHIGTVPLMAGRYDNVKYGATLRYQLHVVRNQILVPTAALVYDAFRMKNGDGSVNSFSSPSILFGGMFNLGFFDSFTAREGHQSLGLLRSYLTLEFRPSISFPYSGTTSTGAQMAGSNWYDGKTVSCSIWYFGIRLEFE